MIETEWLPVQIFLLHLGNIGHLPHPCEDPVTTQKAHLSGEIRH